MTLGQRIKERRLELGLSQTELARQAGTEARQIRRYEADETQPALTLAGLLAKALRMTLDDLVGGDEDPLVGTWEAAIGDRADPTRLEITIESAGSAYAIRLISSSATFGELWEVDDDVYAMELRAPSPTGGLTARLRLQGGVLVGLALRAVSDGAVGVAPLELRRLGGDGP